MDDKQSPVVIPGGIEHFDVIRKVTRVALLQSDKALEKHRTELEFLGTALAALYEGSTCHRRCLGGHHLLEKLCGRAYNLGASAFLLAVRGFYDEALNLIRSVGEIANLVMLGGLETDTVEKWATSDKRTRLREFHRPQSGSDWNSLKSRVRG